MILGTAWKKILMRSGVALGAVCAFCACVYLSQPVSCGCSNDDLIFQTVLPVQTQEESNVPQEKVVYLTFDDGPSKVTEQILDTLKEKNAVATFFVMADENNDKFLPILKRTVAEGHCVALHTCSHSYKKIYASPEAFWQDINELSEKLTPYGCGGSMILRFPGGSTNTVSRRYGGSDIMKTLMRQAEEKGYRYVDWNVCAEDAVGGSKSPETIYNNIIHDVDKKSTCVVLMHDAKTNQATADALPDIIDWFRNTGFRFDTVEHLEKQI